MDPTESEFLLVIPAYNEGRRLGNFLPFLVAKLEDCRLRSRVVVVDDGSTKEDSTAMHALCKSLPAFSHVCVEYLKLQGNCGKGGAIYAGWDTAKSEPLLAFVDADGSISPEETCRILALAIQQPNAAHFASRIKMRGRKVERTASRHRIGRIFATLVGTFIDSEIYDSQCGFKILPAAQYKKIAPLLTEYRFAFDIELLAALNYVRCPVVEHPIDWREVAGSKVSVISDSLQMAKAVLSIAKRSKKWRAMPTAS